ncbi:MAG: hypothetical protein HDR00_15750 [Lachnospiraceae bacterium]|nr:hypothetical protein [Lachnospiraceae bacterium]
MISELKQVQRKLLTNCYIDEARLAKAICKEEVIYEYSKNNYLNLLMKDDAFSRLYFHIANIDAWEFQGSETIYVCDIFFRKENQLLDRFIKLICQKGFKSYAVFHKWACKAPSKVTTQNNSTKFVQYETDDAIKVLFQYFDKYTDFLPRKSELQLFLKKKKFICVYDTINDDFLGALIYTEKEFVITEEFLFVKKEKRGQNISNLLYKYLYDLYSHKKCNI